MARVLAQGKEPEKAHLFRANSDFDWDQPLRKRRKGAGIAPIIALAILLIALGAACWYFFTHFSLGSQDGDSLPVTGSSGTSISQTQSVPDPAAPSQPDDSTPQDSGGTQLPPDDSADISGAPGDGQDVSEPAVSSSQASAGMVYPFR